MSLCLKEVEKFLTYFLRSHHDKKRYLKYNPAKIHTFCELWNTTAPAPPAQFLRQSRPDSSGGR
jgi:hypothetical protein